MNRTQKAIIASWVILTGSVICIYFRWHVVLPYVALLFVYVRGHLVENKATVRKYFSNRIGMTIAVMACAITPFAWFAYRVFSAPSLPETIGRELLGLSTPLLVTMIIFDRWLYLHNKRMTIPSYTTDSHESKKQNKSCEATGDNVLS